MNELNLQAFGNFPELRTPRLRLRALRPEDAEAIRQMRSNPNVNRFIPRPEQITLAEAEAMVQKVQDGYRQQQLLAWAAEWQEQSHLIGTCGFNRIDHQNLLAELGGELEPAYWGKHLALEAVQAIVQFGFQTLQLHRIEAKVAPENRGAIYLLQHLGFRQEGHLRECVRLNGTFKDTLLFGLLAGETTKAQPA